MILYGITIYLPPQTARHIQRAHYRLLEPWPHQVWAKEDGKLILGSQEEMEKRATEFRQILHEAQAVDPAGDWEQIVYRVVPLPN